MGKEFQSTIEDKEKLGGSVMILDIPAIHRGYIELLKKCVAGGIKTLYLVGEDILSEIGAPKEIRAVDPETTKKLLKGLELPFDIEILHLDGISDLPTKGLLTVDDTISRKMRERFFPDAWVTEETVFLRWDESNVTSPQPGQFDHETNNEFHVEMMKRAKKLADNSSDWWRRVGVVVVRDGVILAEGYNHALLSENQPYIDGNPRDFIEAGTLGFLGNTIHAEQVVISSSRGINLEGADLYLNSYPCSPCAEMMGLSGIKRCFFTGGNAYLNVHEILRKWGIETIFVHGGELSDGEIDR